MAHSKALSHSSAAGNFAQNPWWKGVPGEEHVVKLDHSNFDKILNDRSAFVMFFAQWCGYSRIARQAFAEVAQQLSQEGSHILIAALDCDECKDISARYRDIKGYPSFIFFSKAVPKEAYGYARTRDAFYKWIKQIQHQQQEQHSLSLKHS